MSTSLKSQFLLDPDVVFLNHGSFGATPRPVLEACQGFQLELEREPVRFLSTRARELLIESRKLLSPSTSASAPMTSSTSPTRRRP